MRTVPQPAVWLTLREAAEHAKRSYSWAWERMVLGTLESEPGARRPRRVSAASVARELERELRRNGIRKFAARNRRPKPYLIIDNTKAK